MTIKEILQLPYKIKSITDVALEQWFYRYQPAEIYSFDIEQAFNKLKAEDLSDIDVRVYKDDWVDDECFTAYAIYHNGLPVIFVTFLSSEEDTYEEERWIIDKNHFENLYNYVAGKLEKPEFYDLVGLDYDIKHF